MGYLRLWKIELTFLVLCCPVPTGKKNKTKKVLQAFMCKNQQRPFDTTRSLKRSVFVLFLIKCHKGWAKYYIPLINVCRAFWLFSLNSYFQNLSAPPTPDNWQGTFVTVPTFAFFLWNVIGCFHIQHFPACFSTNEVCFPCHRCGSAEGVVFTLEIVCQGRLNLLAHNVISPLGDRAPFVQQQEISLRAPKTFLVPRPHPFTNCVL